MLVTRRLSERTFRPEKSELAAKAHSKKGLSPEGTKTRRARGRRGDERRIAPALLFTARFLGIWLLALFAIVSTPAAESWAIGNTVGAVKTVLGWMVPGSFSLGPTVGAGSIQFEIAPDCTPLMSILVFVAACLAYPAPWPWKLAGVTGGALILWAYNLVRVLALFGVMARWPAAFDFFHVLLWQSVTLIVVLALFIVWLRIVQGLSIVPHPAANGRESASP